MFYNRKFELASIEERERVDLRIYKKLITDTVKKIVPNATVTVNKDHYIIDELTKGQSRSLGRELSKTELVKHCQMVCRLFTGSQATQEKKKQKEKKYENRK